MGFISKLLGLLGGPAGSALRTSAPSQARTGHRAHNANLRDDWLTLTQPYFFGRAYRSPNGRWIVGCGNSDGAGSGGSGRVVLIDHQSDKVMHELKCFARPMDAAVSDSGSYIVQDAGFGSVLRGDVIAIGPDGHERHRRRYSANVFNIGLSRCGRYGAVQTANAPGSDGNLLEVLDLDRGCLVFSVQPTSGWADQYSFDVDDEGRLNALGVVHKGLGHFRYSPGGEFQNAQEFQAARLAKGDFGAKLMLARDLLKTDTTPDNAQKALNAADAALSEGANDRPDWGSVAHRIRGESYEVLGQFPEALEAFELALSLNPKVGVEKRAMALRKKLGVD